MSRGGPIVCYCDECGFSLERIAFDEYYEYERNVCNRCKADAAGENLDIEQEVEDFEEQNEDDYDDFELDEEEQDDAVDEES